MAPPKQLIYADNPGSLPASYTLPPGLDLALQSIVARVDGTGASASFRPCLAVYSQDGKLMARVPAQQTFAIGDTGVVTWAPFLKAASTASTTSLGGCAAYRTTNFSVANSAYVPVDFTSESFDDSGYHDNVTNPSRFTVPADGVYLLTAAASWDSSAAGARELAIAKNAQTSANDALSVYVNPAGTSINSASSLSAIDKCSAGDYYELYAWQNSGGTRTLDVTAWMRPRFGIFRLA